MTTEFKMPEPVGRVDGHCWQIELFGEDIEVEYARLKAVDGALIYTSSDMRAVIEQCAAECEQAKDLYDASTLYGHVPGILQIRADRIRELLEQVK